MKNLIKTSFPTSVKGFVIIGILQVMTFVGYAATITSAAVTGDWSSTTSWVGGVVPLSTDDVVIANGSNITVSDARTAKSLVINTGGTLSAGAGNFTVTTTTSIDGTFAITGAGTKTFTGNVTINAGGTWTGTAGVTSSLSFGTGSTFTNNATAAQTDNSSSTYTFNQTGGVNMNFGTNGFSMYNMTESSANPTWLGNFTVRNALNTGQFKLGANANLYLQGTLTSSSNWSNGNSSAVLHYSGTGQTVVGGLGYANGVSIENGQTATLSANEAFKAGLYIAANTTFNDGGKTIDLQGTYTGTTSRLVMAAGSTFKLTSGSFPSNMASNSATLDATSTMEFAGTGTTYTYSNGNFLPFGNVVLSGTATLTNSYNGGTTRIAGNLTIGNGTTVKFGNTGTYTVNGNVTNNGTFDASNSSSNKLILSGGSAVHQISGTNGTFKANGTNTSVELNDANGAQINSGATQTIETLLLTSGTFTNKGTLTVKNAFSPASGKTFVNDQNSNVTFQNNVANSGTITNLCGGTITIQGTFSQAASGIVTGPTSSAELSKFAVTTTGTNNGKFGVGADGTAGTADDNYISYCGGTLGGTVGTTNVKNNDCTAPTCNSAPVITTSVATLTNFGYCVGSGPSSSQNYTVSGSNLTTDITVTAPADYEVSKDNTTFASSVTYTPASGSVTNQTVYVRLKAGLAVGTYNAENVTNASTGATTVNVAASGTVYNTPTAASAGSDATICANGSTVLAANNPAVGTGAWSVVSGPSTSSTQFSSTSSNTATFTPASGAGSYVLRWTVSNGSCTASTSDVTITVTAAPTTSNAGGAQSICTTGSATLAANSPATGTGAWTVVSGPSTSTAQFSSTTSNTATFTPASGAGTYKLRWTISNGTCTSSTSDVDITVVGTPTAANAGSNQSFCSSSSATLAANSPATGTGAWSVVSGPSTASSQFSSTSSNSATFTPASGPGTYVLRWTTSNSPCASSTSDVTMTVNGPTTANAGADQTTTLTTATLAGNTPTVGTGTWTLVSGSGTITTPSSPTSGITGLANGANTFRWTTTSGGCSTSDDVIITVTSCPVPSTCNTTIAASSAANQTVNAGETLCITGGTYTGTVTLNNGSTIYVASGATFSGSVTASATSNFINCGTMDAAKTFTFNNNLTFSNYSPNATLNFVQDNGFKLTNYATGVNLMISGNPNTAITIVNEVGASITVGNSNGNSQTGSSITNKGTFNVNTSYDFSIFRQVNITNNAGATFTSTKASGNYNYTATMNNQGTMSIASGTSFKLSGSITNGSSTNQAAVINFTSGEFRMDGGSMSNYATASVTDFYTNSGNIAQYKNALFTITGTTGAFNNTFTTPTNECSSVYITNQATTNQNSDITASTYINVCGPIPLQDEAASKTITNITLVANGAGSADDELEVTVAGHGYSAGNKVYVYSISAGLTDANGYWTITSVTANTFRFLKTSSQTYTAGGKVVVSTAAKAKIGSANYLGYSGCANPCAPLPIELLSFDVFLMTNSVQINWVTLKEKNVDYFVVERSTDGIHFTAIDSREPLGNSYENYYFSNDSDPLSGIIYYRLKEVDFDGDVYYSQIKKVQIQKNTDWIIYPNPSDGEELFIKLNNSDPSKEMEFEIEIFDAVGQSVFSKKLSGNAEKPIRIMNDRSDLAAGVYVVKVTTEDSQKATLLVIK